MSTIRRILVGLHLLQWFCRYRFAWRADQQHDRTRRTPFCYQFPRRVNYDCWRGTRIWGEATLCHWAWGGPRLERAIIVLRWGCFLSCRISSSSVNIIKSSLEATDALPLAIFVNTTADWFMWLLSVDLGGIEWFPFCCGWDNNSNRCWIGLIFLYFKYLNMPSIPIPSLPIPPRLLVPSPTHNKSLQQPKVTPPRAGPCWVGAHLSENNGW